MLIDTHCHLQYLDQNNVDSIIENAFKNKIEKIIAIAVQTKDINILLNYCKKYKGKIYCTIGQHPCNVDDYKPTSKELCDIVFNNKDYIVGIGETGLDYYVRKNPFHLFRQRQLLQTHIEVACETKLPIIIHNRNSDKDIHKMIKAGVKNGLTGIIHCFNASEDFMHKMTDLGFYISIAGIVTFERAGNLPKIVKKIPLDKLLVETDSPYLAPVPKYKEINEPANVLHTANRIADIIGISRGELHRITTRNAKTIFNIK